MIIQLKDSYDYSVGRTVVHPFCKFIYLLALFLGELVSLVG